MAYYSRDLAIRELQVGGQGATAGAVRLMGAWQLTSSDSRFGGFSALIALPGGRLRSYSDHGDWFAFHPPGQGVAASPAFGSLRTSSDKWWFDVESATYDPGSRRTWVGLENTNQIWRLGPAQAQVEKFSPAAMKRWRNNRGPESLTRLRDGRFIVIEEGGADVPLRHGLLFNGDPLSSPNPLSFRFKPPAGYSPSDAAAMPDGRVLILLRRVEFTGFPPFSSRLVMMDPADIRPGREVPWVPVADISAIAPRENYEGLAIVPYAGGLTLWVISDSNDAVMLQRTLLLRLHWRPPLRKTRSQVAASQLAA